MNRRLVGQILAPVLAAGVAIVVSSIALLLADESPVEAFQAMWSNIDGTGAFILIVNRAVPYYVAGVAVAIGFKMNLFNIGAAGQYQLAALLAAAAGAAVSLWAPLHVLFVFLVATSVGAAYAAIAGILEVWRGVNEVISTIMLNYIAIGIERVPAVRPAAQRPQRQPRSDEVTARLRAPAGRRPAVLGDRRALPERRIAARVPAVRHPARHRLLGAAQPQPLRVQPAACPAPTRRRHGPPA